MSVRRLLRVYEESACVEMWVCEESACEEMWVCMRRVGVYEESGCV